MTVDEYLAQPYTHVLDFLNSRIIGRGMTAKAAQADAVRQKKMLKVEPISAARLASVVAGEAPKPLQRRWQRQSGAREIDWAKAIKALAEAMGRAELAAKMKVNPFRLTNWMNQVSTPSELERDELAALMAQHLSKNQTVRCNLLITRS